MLPSSREDDWYQYQPDPSTAQVDTGARNPGFHGFWPFCASQNFLSRALLGSSDSSQRAKQNKLLLSPIRARPCMALATSVDFLGPTKTFVDSEYLTFTSSELQNVQLKPKKFARDVEMPTKCLVCGQHTNCCNYDVASCIGCKAFFRRSLLASKTYECKLSGMCSRMHGMNRCRACRFDRCLLAGMNPRAMQFPTSVDVAKFFDKVANRRRYLLEKYGERCPVVIAKTGLVFEETIEDKTIQSLVYVELKVRQIRESSRWLSESVIFRSIRELLEPNRENALAHADRYPKELTWPLTYEKALKIELNERPLRWIMLDLFLCIEMARTMPVFLQLDYNDQEALLKQAILINALLLEAFYSCQMKSETFIMPSGFLPVKLPSDDRLKGILQRMKLPTRLTMEAMSRIQMTTEEFVLLKAIIYSHSAIDGLSERGRVLLEKESIRYSKTLMKHLQSRLGAAPAAKKYAEIVSIVGSFFHGAQKLRQLHIYVETYPQTPRLVNMVRSVVRYVKWNMHIQKKTMEFLEHSRRFQTNSNAGCELSGLD
ncbi:zinc finger, c4 type (two domains) domain-containing protein [Ditylenchus destructor]|uniref:Zinc finger, c4 type (Two domains) domain-containing protein n=1 Tax=Ditylenchus destructor TaxID=166010 RepID=A0AAD4QZ59_9BILA|nr:zinc finger, c4 type (two domains) domain-containing protein [Ditylenchus destructor]